MKAWVAKVELVVMGLIIVLSPFGVVAFLLAFPSAPKATNLPATIASVRGAVVCITKDAMFSASGCIVSPDGIVFTARHLTNGVEGVYSVSLDDGRVFGVKYVVEDRVLDIAFLKLDMPKGMTLKCVKLSPYARTVVGESVFMIGSPHGFGNFNTVSVGIVSALGRNLRDRDGWSSVAKYNWLDMVQSTSPAFPGNSGGPVFNMRGEVIGALVAGEDATLNFSVPVAHFAGLLPIVERMFAECDLRVITPQERPAVFGEGPEDMMGNLWGTLW
jgi:S1-C subfamily serine protease